MPRAVVNLPEASACDGGGRESKSVRMSFVQVSPTAIRVAHLCCKDEADFDSTANDEREDADDPGGHNGTALVVV